MIASMLDLSRSDMKNLRLTDRYSIHRIIYDLYEDVRTDDEKKRSIPSGIQFADKGGNWNNRKILMLANRPPREPEFGTLESTMISDDFVEFDKYRFDVELNPVYRDGKSKKLVPVRGRRAIEEWIMSRSENNWGFSIEKESLVVSELAVKSSETKKHMITHGSAKISGVLNVKDRQKFITSFHQGIGKGRAFGMGLLQIVPIFKEEENYDVEYKPG